MPLFAILIFTSMMDNSQYGKDFAITRRIPLTEIPDAFRMFRDKGNEIMRQIIVNH